MLLHHPHLKELGWCEDRLLGTPQQHSPGQGLAPGLAQPRGVIGEENLLD